LLLAAFLKRTYKPFNIIAVFIYSFLGDQSVGSPHFVQDVSHPVLNPAIRGNGLLELHHLAFTGDHRCSQGLVRRAVLETKTGNIVEHLKARTVKKKLHLKPNDFNM
jgi:hypothetical protein